MKLRKLLLEDDPIYNSDDFADILRIREVLRRKGWNASLRKSHALWTQYSDSMCAGWMSLPVDDQELYDCISPYITQ